MKFDLFSVEYLQFIFSNIWTFLGFIIILSIITGDLKKIIGGVKAFFDKVKTVYISILNRKKEE